MCKQMATRTVTEAIQVRVNSAAIAACCNLCVYLSRALSLLCDVTGKKRLHSSRRTSRCSISLFCSLARLLARSLFFV